MGSPELAYKEMLKEILLQFNRAISNPIMTEDQYDIYLCEFSYKELETLIKVAFPNNPEYKLFMAGAGMSNWIANACVEEWNAGAGMIKEVYKLLEIIAPEEKEEEV